MSIIAEPKKANEALRLRRLSRYHRRIGNCLDRHDIDGAYRAIREYQQTHSESESRLEHLCDLVERLIADPPFLYDGEHDFLKAMARRTASLGLEPTKKQAQWLERIAQRRRRP